MRWIGVVIGVAFVLAVAGTAFEVWHERRAQRSDPEPPAEQVAGYWDYAEDPNNPMAPLHVVLVDQDGAGRLACATTPGDQLKHLQCPLDGPCAFVRTGK